MKGVYKGYLRGFMGVYGVQFMIMPDKALDWYKHINSGYSCDQNYHIYDREGKLLELFE